MKLGAVGKIGVGWTICTVVAIYSFYLSKENIIKKRYAHMKVRERMQNSNVGEYPASSRKYTN